MTNKTTTEQSDYDCTTEAIECYGGDVILAYEELYKAVTFHNNFGVEKILYQKQLEKIVTHIDGITRIIESIVSKRRGV